MGGTAGKISPYWKHLRVPFQLTLAPIFLWGALLAGFRPIPTFLLAFVSFHFFLYTGVTAYNSAFDRDEGPVGGMLHPPKVPARLLEFSLVVQGVGAALAALAGFSILFLYGMFFVLGIAYSHPKIRLKRRPWASAFVVLVGQGLLGFLAGWIAVGEPVEWNRRLVLGAATAAFTTLGLYPLTQVYQVEEDSQRGDRTLAVVLGARKAIRFGLACFLFAAGCATLLLVLEGDRVGACVLGLAYVGLAVWLERLSRKEHPPVQGFRNAMRLNIIASAGFLAFIILKIIRLI